MIVQLTDYGVSILNETKKPLSINRYTLGSSYNYTPSQTATGIKGVKVYENTMTKPIAVSANVVKYIATLGYFVGNFSFGEAAFYDETETCVAIAVSDELIDKQKYEDRKVGNSIVLDLYLSMVEGNYDMWIDDMRSDNEFNLPVCGSPDALPPVDQSSSNFYIITNAGRGQSSTLAYASMTGLWDFDCYQYKNSHEFTITGCTAGTVTLDATNFTADDILALTPDFAGQLIAQFTNGPNTSICRSIATFRLIGKEATLAFFTPMATLADVGNTIRIYSRQAFSISDVNLPVATKESLGAIIVGDGLSVTPYGNLSVDFPVTSVNGMYGDVIVDANAIPGLSDVAITGDYNDLENKPSVYRLPVADNTTLGGVKIEDESDFTVDFNDYLRLTFDAVKSVNNLKPDPGTGNVTIKFDEQITGLIFPKRVYAQSDLDEYSASGLYFILAEDANTLINGPDFQFGDDITLEVIPVGEGYENGSCVQRITTTGAVLVRQNTGTSWTPWSRFLTTGDLPIASAEELGMIRVGDTLKIDENGILDSKITSVFGQTEGDIYLDKDQWLQQLSLTFNTFNGILQLTDDGSEGVAEDQKVAAQMQYGRARWRELTYGSFFFAGNWDPATNTLNQDTNQKLLDGGQVTHVDADFESFPIAERTEDMYKTWRPNGWVVLCSNGSRSITLDGITRFDAGDLLLCINNRWLKILENRSVLARPKLGGFVFLDDTSKATYGRAISSSNGSIAVSTTYTVDASAGTITDLNIIASDLNGGTY